MAANEVIGRVVISRYHYDSRTIENRIISAVEGAVDDWAAYEIITKDEVTIEDLEASTNGFKIKESLAKELFPDIARELTWRA